MIRESLLDQLKACDAGIEKCERDLAQQRRLIADLERDGHRSTEAVSILEKMEMVLSSSKAERENLQAMLDTQVG